MPAVFELFSDLGTAGATALRGATRIDSHEQTTGTFSLVRQLGEKATPTGIIHGLGQHARRQAFNVQVFNRNQAVGLNQALRQLVVEVLTLVANVRVNRLQFAHRLAAAMTAFLAPGHFALGSPKTGLSLSVLTRIGNDRAVGQHGEALQAHIEADRQQGISQGLSLDLDAETDVPLTRFTLERHGLDLAVYGPVELDLQDTHPLNAQLARGQKTNPVTVGRKGNAVEALMRLKAGKAGLFASFDAAKEGFVGLIHPTQNVLTARKISQADKSFSANLFELIGLSVVVDGRTRHFPCVPSLLQGCIVEFAAFAQLLFKGLLLGFVGIKAIAKRLTQNKP